jgi:hypothetical protein
MLKFSPFSLTAKITVHLCLITMKYDSTYHASIYRIIVFFDLIEMFIRICTQQSLESQLQQILGSDASLQTLILT